MIFLLLFAILSLEKNTDESILVPSLVSKIIKSHGPSPLSMKLAYCTAEEMKHCTSLNVNKGKNILSRSFLCFPNVFFHQLTGCIWRLSP
jgi:hypothetical protein